MQERTSQEQLEREQGNQEREAMAWALTIGTVSELGSLATTTFGILEATHVYKCEIFVEYVYMLIFSFSHFKCEMQRLYADWWQ